MMWKYIHAHVFICSASLCLLVGSFNPFTFKVIIHRYDPTTIFLIVWGLFSVGRAFSTNVCLVKAMVFPVVLCGCERWTIKKVERQRIDAL